MVRAGLDKGIVTMVTSYLEGVTNMAKELRVLTDDFKTVPEAARELGKPKVTLYRWIDSNKLIAVTFGGKLFVPKSEIERLKKQEGG